MSSNSTRCRARVQPSQGGGRPRSRLIKLKGSCGTQVCEAQTSNFSNLLCETKGHFLSSGGRVPWCRWKSVSGLTIRSVNTSAIHSVVTRCLSLCALKCPLGHEDMR